MYLCGSFLIIRLPKFLSMISITLSPESIHPGLTALGLVNIITTLSPHKIILGGGVIQQPQLFKLVRQEVQSLLTDYIQVPEILDKIDTNIVPPMLGGKAGVLGSIALALRVFNQN